MASRKSTPSRREQRNLRLQQAVFVAVGVIVILTMVIGLIAK